MIPGVIGIRKPPKTTIWPRILLATATLFKGSLTISKQ